MASWVPQGPRPALKKVLHVVNLLRVVNTAIYTIAAHLVRTPFCWELRTFFLSKKGSQRRNKSGGRSKNTLRRSNSLFFAIIVVFLVRKGSLGVCEASNAASTKALLWFPCKSPFVFKNWGECLFWYFSGLSTSQCCAMCPKDVFSTCWTGPFRTNYQGKGRKSSLHGGENLKQRLIILTVVIVL